MMMVLVVRDSRGVGVMTVMVVRGQAQRRRSQQRRIVAAVTGGGAATAEAQRVRSHEVWWRRNLLIRSCHRGYLGRRGDLLEQADADVIGGTRGTAAGGGVAGRGSGRSQQRIQAQAQIWLYRAQLGAHFLIMYARLLEIVDEVASRPVRAEADRVEGAAQLGLVLGMAGEVAQLAVAVRELTLVAVLAHPALLERPAELGLVARRRLADAAIELSMMLHQRGH